MYSANRYKLLSDSIYAGSGWRDLKKPYIIIICQAIFVAGLLLSVKWTLLTIAASVSLFMILEDSKNFLYLFLFVFAVFQHKQVTPLDPTPIYHYKFFILQIVDFLIMLYIFLAFTQQLFKSKLGFDFQLVVNKPLKVFLIAIIIASIYGVVFYNAGLKSTLLEIRPFLYLFAAYMITYHLLESESQLIRLLKFLFAIIGIKAVLGLLLMRFDPDRVDIFTGPFTYHSLEVLYLLFAICFMISMLVTGIRMREFKRLFKYFGVFIILCEIFAFRRNIYLSFTVSLPVFLLILPKEQIRRFYTNYRKQIILSLVVLLILISAAGFMNPVIERFQSIFNVNVTAQDIEGAAASNLYRIWETYNGLIELSKHPIMGIGWGTAWERHIPWLLESGESKPWTHFHNSWLSFWLKGGLLTFVAGIALFALPVMRAYKLRAEGVSDLQILFYYSFAFYAVCMAISITFAMYIYQFRFSVFFGFLLAISDWYTYKKSKEESK